MKANISQDDLQKATAATLRAHPTSNEAKALVADLAFHIAQRELASSARKNRRKDTAGSFEYAVGAFVADLLKPLGSERPHEWVYRSMHAKSFSGKQVAHRTFKRLVEQLTALGFVDRVQGYHVSDDRSDTGVYAARFRATPMLLQLCERHGVAPTQALDHFKYEYDLPEHPLQLRAAKEKNFFGSTKEPSGKPIEYTRDSVTKLIEGRLRELNEFFSRQTLRGGSHEGYVRIYNNGDDPTFYWNLGGRLYSHRFADSYQTLSADKRAEMTINGEAVAEIDIRASYLSIYLSWHDQQLDRHRDPYVLEDLGEAWRDAVKAWMVATFGSAKPARKWSPRMLKDQPKLRDYSVAQIREQVLKQYPVLAQWGVTRRKGHVATWADLMWEESLVMTLSMEKLMHEHSVPSLSVHDSLIVPASKAELAARLLTEQFKTITSGKQPILIIRQKGLRKYQWIPENPEEERELGGGGREEGGGGEEGRR